MPGAWRARVMNERLRAEGIEAVVVECDVFSLEGAERQTVFEAMIDRMADVPMVLVDGVVVCTDGVGLNAMVTAARQCANESQGL